MLNSLIKYRQRLVWTKNLLGPVFNVHSVGYRMCTVDKNNPNYNPEIPDAEKKLFRVIDRLPERAQQFLKLGRYDRPIGYLLLFYPCAWGLTLGATSMGLVYLKYMSLFYAGSVLMRSSGCIINDMWDKSLDKQVTRCQSRPIAAEKISYKEAALFLSAHLTASLWILLQLPISSIIAGFSVMPLVCIYPYMKRVTHFPQFFLGLAFNSGVIVCYPAMSGLIDWSVVLPVYFAGVCWTMIYDTIYAHMDKTDDVKINVKSTAIYFDEHTKWALAFFSIIMIGLLYYGINRQNKEDKDKHNYIESELTRIHTDNITSDNNIDTNSRANILLAVCAMFQFYSIYKVNLNSPTSCLKMFKANHYFGLLVFAAVAISKYNSTLR